MQQGDPLFSWEGRHQQADTGNWGSMMAFPSMAQVLQTELQKKLHHEGHCDGKHNSRYHHSPLGGPQKDQQPCGRLGIGLPPQTFGSPTSTEGTIGIYSPAGEGPVPWREPHLTNLQHVRWQVTRRGLWSGHQGNYPTEGSSWLHQLHGKVNENEARHQYIDVLMLLHLPNTSSSLGQGTDGVGEV